MEEHRTATGLSEHRTKTDWVWAIGPALLDLGILSSATHPKLRPNVLAVYTLPSGQLLLFFKFH